jgi:GNAT superfamily N-acetyltransferase
MVPNAGLTVRERTPDDLAACIAMLRHVHGADGYPSSWPVDPQAWLTPRGLLGVWVAYHDSRLVGHVAAGGVDDRADPHLVIASGCAAREIVEVKRLFVAPDARGLGAGRELLHAAAAFAIGRGRQPVLEVTADRRAAIRLYEHSGWQRVATNVATWTRASGERPLLHQYLLMRPIQSARQTR